MSSAEAALHAPSIVAAAPPSDRPAATVITTAAEAIAAAQAFAAEIAPGAAERDRQRILPRAELDRFSATGLWAITVPQAYGGADLSYVTLTEVIKIVSAADPSIGQIPQNHLGVVDILRLTGTEAQKRFLFGEVLKGRRFGNAFSEKGSKYAAIFDTKISADGDDFVIDGEKFYATGALFADWIPIAATGSDGKVYLAFAEQGSPGLTIIDDWSGFGQRTTASGTVRLQAVRVAADRVIPAHSAFENPTANGPISQIIQAAVDAGIAQAAIDDTIRFVRDRARPWVDSGQDKASDDPYTLAAIGDLVLRLHAAEAILEKAALAVDRAVASPDEATVAAASLAVAEAKVLTTEIAVQAGNKLFELAGTRSTLAADNLDRHWRNARTHTLHDPVRWKFHHLGNYHLNGVLPPRHAWL